MKLLTLTKITLTKINITWQLLVEVRKSQQDWFPMVLIRQYQLQSVELKSSLTLAHRLPVHPWQHHPPQDLCLSSLGWKVSPEGSFPGSAGNAEAQEMCRQKWSLAPPHAHSQTSPWACSAKNCSGWAPDGHSLDLQSVHSLLPAPLLPPRWLCLTVNYMWLDQVLHAVLVSSKDSVWITTLRC